MRQAGEPHSGALSLEQIERDAWGEPPADATWLIRTAYELRRKPVATFTAEDLRLMIGQKVGVTVLLPHALTLLASDPLVEGDFYPGDLLVAVMRLPPEYWAGHPGQMAAVRKIAMLARQKDSGLQGAVDEFLSLTERPHS